MLDRNDRGRHVDAGHADSSPQPTGRPVVRQGRVQPVRARRCISVAARFRVRASGTTRCLSREPPCFLQHVGLYAYRREFLLEIAQLPPSPLEQLEKLEQLRVLSAGKTILVSVIDEPTIGIDTWDDYRAFVSRATIC